MANSVWVGERRLGLIRVSEIRQVAGFGALPWGRLRLGEVALGGRARLLRAGKVIAEDLRIGALATDKGPETSVTGGRRFAVAIGWTDVRAKDFIEVYERAAQAEADPELVPGYHAAAPEDEVMQGCAEVRGVGSGSPAVLAVITAGRLAVGDRVRVVREGRTVAETLRVHAVTGRDGRPIDELPADGGASVHLGYQGLRAGDTLVAYSVPSPQWTEVRSERLGVLKAGSDGVMARAGVVRLRSAAGEAQLEAGHRARVLRGDTVIADGLTIGHRHHLMVTQDRTSMEVSIDFPYLRPDDVIEPYQVIPADQEPPGRRPESTRLLVGVTVLLGTLGLCSGWGAVEGVRIALRDEEAWPLAMTAFLGLGTVMLGSLLVYGHMYQAKLRRRYREKG
ncbi:hypothetical protein [Spirillospora sp. CA-294931]|uniref:hypothetical protein n=1 Tax=Spirillospora sp. CA-294931 TaxID=3240042 RepID=UPI003D907B2B